VVGRRYPTARAVTIAFAGVLAGALVMPAAAPADIPVPLLPDIPFPSPAELVRSVLQALFDLLFGDIPRKITGPVLRWLLTHPEFGADSRFDTLETGAARVRELGYALSVGFYCAGLVRHVADDAAGGAVEATRRFAFAVVGITAWPWVFTLAVRFSNLATEAFLQVPQLSRTTVALLSFAFIAGAATGISFICGLLAAILLIALFLEKILVLTGLTVLYVLTPAVLAAYPFPPTSHLTGVASGALTALLVINPLWTALIAVFALVGEGALTVGAAAVEDFIEPLIAIAMLGLVVGALPLLMRMAWVRGVMASLATPVTGPTHGGGSALATLSMATHAAGGIRGVLQQRSERQLQQTAWSLTTTAPGGAAPFAAAGALPAAGAAARTGEHEERRGGPTMLATAPAPQGELTSSPQTRAVPIADRTAGADRAETRRVPADASRPETLRQPRPPARDPERQLRLPLDSDLPREDQWP
jgi:hypothetical protein